MLVGVFTANSVNAAEEDRSVEVFSEISLNVGAKLFLTQGDDQSVRIVAQSSALEELITEVKGRKLIIRFPTTKMFSRNFNPGKIEIYISVPEVDALQVAGTGSIVTKALKSRILEMTVSGSGVIELDELDSKKVKALISGSGNINVGQGGVAEELVVSISGSGNFNGKDFSADKVNVRTSGSGSCTVKSNGSLNARIAGSGNIYYGGNPSIDSSVVGSGKVEKL